MKKIFALLIVSLLLVSGCALLGSTPKDEVAKFLNNYKKNSENVTKELDEYLDTQDLEEDTLKDYRELYLKQYSNLKYEIKNEKIDGDTALVEVQITVYDYYKTDKMAGDYFTTNQSDFVDDDGDIDFSKYFEYKIKKLLDTTDTVDYTLTLNLKKENDKWEVEPLTNDELMKLHGTYEY
ncbi:MAG: hypothetical protein J1F35_07470 [Erysipelotrichales bacterium]|nr:hypothetical protein [Erysipelotrichales bacterium]